MNEAPIMISHFDYNPLAEEEMIAMIAGKPIKEELIDRVREYKKRHPGVRVYWSHNGDEIF